MKVMKRGLAVLLAVMFMIPIQPVRAEAPVGVEVYEPKEGTQEVPELEHASVSLKKASPDNADEPVEVVKKATPDSAEETKETAGKIEQTEKIKKAEDEVIVNTGNYACRIVGKEDFFDHELGDGYFEDDGSYVIEIPEPNPFFPYEVQFTYQGKVTNQWFMNPEDVVEVGGHEFTVSAHFDGKALTQMSLNIAGDTVVVYPEKKTFTSDDAVPLSLLPLKEKKLELNLTGYTPAELTMISFDQVFKGADQLNSSDQIIWTYSNGKDNYTISMPDDRIDLSYGSAYGNATTWEMIVGSDDQLDADNIRYILTVKRTGSREWLVPQVFIEDETGNRKSIDVTDYSYQESSYDPNPNNFYYYLRIYTPQQLLDLAEKTYIGLQINDSIFASTNYDHLKVYEGLYRSASDAMGHADITDEIFCTDMSANGSGYLKTENDGQGITIVTFDASGNATGCLPIVLFLYGEGNWMDFSLIERSDTAWTEASNSVSYQYNSEYNDIRIMLKRGYSTNRDYYLFMKYHKGGVENSSDVIAAYRGLYRSVSEAEAAGAEEIKDELLNGDYSTGGFKGDYSQGITFTVFVKDEKSEYPNGFLYRIKSEEWIQSISGNTYVTFLGLKDKKGNEIPSYVVSEDEDSYGEYNYLTMMVDQNVNLDEVAPVFDVYSGLNLYTADRSAPEVSGVSLHNFSDGPVQYTASAENGEDSKNYWLRILKATDDHDQLYMNSLWDETAETTTENGVVYTKREILLDEYHDNYHDILLANMSLAEIPAVSVELSSNEVGLDDYWTLKGVHDLAGFSSAVQTTTYGEYPNLAKIRLKAKDEIDGHKNISGTMTIKSGSKVLMVVTLTGVVGDPSITTNEIPEAVKYVPYGTMIQNNNKYSWNTTVYRKTDGTLPAGMEVRTNGELYGVPTEAGTFTFTVNMDNSENAFSDSTMTYTLTVGENTDINVEKMTDSGYVLTQRVNNVDMNSTGKQTVVSQGVYSEFVDVYLDGVKLNSGEDYTSESGSTRITIRNQTLTSSKKTGTHTIGIEFRTKDTNTLKRAAQNYVVESQSSDNGNGGGGNNGGNNGGGSGGGRGSSQSRMTDPKRGVVDPVKGIITGEGSGYSRWQQDEKGWKLIYADGTLACGYTIELADKSTGTQVIWEKVNGAWYAFGLEGYVAQGWVYDYQLNSWYFMSVETGMKSGWCYDEQDRCNYYLDTETGALATGWRLIDGKWYYFTETSLSPTWRFDEKQGIWVYDLRSRHRPYGAMYHDEKTPDGYYVEKDGSWVR